MPTLQYPIVIKKAPTHGYGHKVERPYKPMNKSELLQYVRMCKKQIRQGKYVDGHVVSKELRARYGV